MVPFFEQRRLRLKLAADARGLVMFDNFNGHYTDGIFELLEANNVDIVIVLVNCTDRLQPIDLSFNKPAKIFLRAQFSEWYSKQVAAHKREGKHVQPVDLHLTKVKPPGTQSLFDLCYHFKANMSIIHSEFKAAGIVDCLK